MPIVSLHRDYDSDPDSVIDSLHYIMIQIPKYSYRTVDEQALV